MILADTIRGFAFGSYIQPVQAKNSFRRLLGTIVSGNVVRSMKLKNRAPAVCGPIDALKFCSDNNLQLVKRSGPKQGLTVTWQFLV
jgi:hypothetical protein